MDFKGILKEQKLELEAIEKEERLINRDIQSEAQSYLEHPNIVALLGIRRCGKSICSYLLAKGHSYGYINFDDDRLAGTKINDLNDILVALYELVPDFEFIVLDELQNIAGWELFANRLRRSKKVIITGSNSKLLFGELSTRLTGRYVDLVLFPFSFQEYLDFRGFQSTKAYTTQEIARILGLLEEYLHDGGFPEPLKRGKALLSRIYDDIITKDAVIKHNIRKVEVFRRMAKYLITNSSQEISYTKLSKILDIKHVDTISKWVQHLEDAFLIIKLERFDFKLKMQFLAPKKVYCIDNGILTSVAFSFSDNTGALMENCVAIELQRRKRFTPHMDIYYWKDHQQNEVDFIIKHGPKVKQLVQVSYVKSKDDVKEREITNLLKASEKLHCNDLLLITWNYKDKITKNMKTISCVPLWAWLMQYP